MSPDEVAPVDPDSGAAPSPTELGIDGLLDGRVVLVTGAAAGVGRGVALAAAAAGATVGLGVRRPEGGEAVAAEIATLGGPPAMVLRGDVTDPDQVRGSVEDLVAAHGRLDAVVHNATSNRSSEPVELETASLDLWQEHASVALTAAFRLARVAHPHLARSRGAYLLMVSPAGIDGSGPLGFYSMVKAGQRGFVKALAREWGPDGIRVNGVAPLAVTPALENRFTVDPSMHERLRALIPLGWFGDPAADIGPPSVFLCSDAARYVTGQTLVVSGGRFTGL
ncbi:SDR family NAD(P)-dependent oxidoreductase [Rhabdothermincola salaria]|uniref:SDR family NAD(P)-dependent oxidoreductase n=1 Tax=Rhabdothermincola salaria TaxID=2903142 RepID=UPI001E57CED7|nr:SDR family oxidoreductase [Rhabdothermincola salaria]MCD9624765.1 SDR family oxidoreductase [Rhabdothermincola salaria]